MPNVVWCNEAAQGLHEGAEKNPSLTRSLTPHFGRRQKRRALAGTATSADDGPSSWDCGGSWGGLGSDIADCWDWELALSSSEQCNCCASSSMVAGIMGLLVWAVC